MSGQIASAWSDAGARRQRRIRLVAAAGIASALGVFAVALRRRREGPSCEEYEPPSRWAVDFDGRGHEPPHTE